MQDGDNDGIVWPTDTYKGFRRLGFNPLLSMVAIPIIHGTFSWWSGVSGEGVNVKQYIMCVPLLDVPCRYTHGFCTPSCHYTTCCWVQDSWLPHPGFPIYMKNVHR